MANDAIAGRPESVQNPLLGLMEANPYPNHQKNEMLYQRIHERMHKFTHFTPLQEKAFRDKHFWDENQSLMIRGATSSGKTLIAEIAMAQCRRSSRKVIYLAPLRAMVSQKYADFKNDFTLSDDRNVYASSRDYQSNDTFITEGTYAVAVMVYEKFYALISQNEASSMMENCGLIVLDEIQMLGEPDRGMKIIMSLIKAKRLCSDVRIIGLSTTYCDVSEVLKWFRDHLKKDLWTIDSPLNALPLEEIVIRHDGRFRGKYVPSARDVVRDDWEELQAEEALRLQSEIDDPDQLSRLEGIDPPPTRQMFRTEDRKKDLLQRVVKLHPGRKLIVFCHSRGYCRTLARMLAENVRKKPLSNDTLKRLQNENQSKVRDELRDVLLPSGVAFHHGALSHSMRSIIEDAFMNTESAPDTARLDVLVATETLAIGVNLPADIIIVYDTQKRNADGEQEPIDEQTYKNYIGRAGRLMRRVDDDFHPRSYLLAMTQDDLRRYWSRYINAKETTIIPVFKRLRESEALPYFLSLVSLSTSAQNGRMVPEDIKKLLDDSIPGVKGVDTFFKLLTGGEDAGLSPRTREDWADAKLTMAVPKNGRHHHPGIALTPFGGDVVPYALSIETCAIIHCFFIDHETGGMPVDLANADLDQNRYLPDILFHICDMPEIRDKFRQIAVARYNSNARLYYDQQSGIFQYYRERLKRLSWKPWSDSLLEENVSVDDYRDDASLLNKLLQVTVLLHWTGGGAINSFQQDTGIPFTLEEGDVERLADVASYLLEAVGNSLSADRDRLSLERSMLRLSNRVKYGCDDACVRILNCHIPGISRQAVLNAQRRARENGSGQSLYHFIMHDDAAMNSIFTRDEITSIRLGLKAKYGEELAVAIANTRREGLLPEGAENLIMPKELERRTSPQTLVDFFELVSAQNPCPFLFRKEEQLTWNQPEVYSAAYLNFRLRFLFYPELADAGKRADADFNGRSFDLRYGDYLRNTPGHYILVCSQEPEFDWNEFSCSYPNCTMTGISSQQLFLLYMHSLPEVAAGINPFLFSLYRSEQGKRLGETVSVPDEAYWRPSDTPRIFISYVHKTSQELACALYDQFEPGTAFLDSIGISASDSFPSILRQAILSCDSYLLLFDDIYGTSASPWTKHEIDAFVRACRDDRSGNKRMIPVILTKQGERTFQRDYPDINPTLYINAIEKPLQGILSEVRNTVQAQ